MSSTEDAQTSSNYEWFIDQINPVIEPIADRCGGWPDQGIRQILSRAWLDAFHTDISAPVLIECAAAIHQDRPWQQALWNGGW